MQELEKIDEEILKIQTKIEEIENDLQNLNELAFRVVEPEFNTRFNKILAKMKQYEEKLKEKVENFNSLKIQVKSYKKMKQGSRAKVAIDKFNLLKVEIPLLESAIKGNQKVFDKLDAEKQKKLQNTIKEINIEKKELLSKLKKELKELKQVHKYKSKGRI